MADATFSEGGAGVPVPKMPNGSSFEVVDGTNALEGWCC